LPARSLGAIPPNSLSLNSRLWIPKKIIESNYVAIHPAHFVTTLPPEHKLLIHNNLLVVLKVVAKKWWLTPTTRELAVFWFPTKASPFHAARRSIPLPCNLTENLSPPKVSTHLLDRKLSRPF